ncbi:MAG: GAF domain-containing protein [bacterium]|nr:GAF domain-containing protein [bacterium]
MTEDRYTLTISFRVGGESRRFEFESGSARLGRGLDCDVLIDDRSVSRYHASVTRVGNAWELVDLDSSNGSFAQDRQVSRYRIVSEETLRLGAVEAHFRVGPPSAAERSNGPRPAESGAEAQTLGEHAFDGLVHSVLSTAAGETLGERAAQVAAEQFLGQSSDAVADPLRGAAWIIKILRDASSSLLSYDALNPTLERIVDLVFEHLPATRCSILMKDAAGQELKPRVERALGAAQVHVRISRHITETAVRMGQPILVKDSARDERFSAVQSIADLQIHSAVCAPLQHGGRVVGLIYADRSSASETFTKTHLEVLSILASLSASAVERARLRETLERERQARERFARYHSPAVVEHILRADADPGREMLAEERIVSVLFGDIVGFTRMSESMSAMEIAALLNELFDRLTHLVFREGGTLDKFIGDNIMVFFGAPLEQPDHAVRAVRTGLAIQRALREFNALRPGSSPIEMRVGINTGPVVVGDIGATSRKDYTVIGDTVNVAGRLESTTCCPGEVVIGAGTHELVGTKFECEPLTPFVPRGKVQAIQPYRVLPGSPVTE